MASNVFINLPDRNLARSTEFFRKAGFQIDPVFTDEDATCLKINKQVSVLLLEEKRFKSFTTKPVCDAHQSTEVLIAINVSTRNQVDQIISNAVKAGGTLYTKPQDFGWMYGHSFADPDGHQWEVVFVDETSRMKP